MIATGNIRDYQREYRRRNRAKTLVYQAAWRARGRATLAAAKASGCIDCGNKDPRVLDFDHVRGEKADCVSRLFRAPKRLTEELAKCEVRCSNCHRIKTWERRQAAAS